MPRKSGIAHRHGDYYGLVTSRPGIGCPSSGFESMSNSIGEMDLSEEGGGELLFELGSGVYIGLLHLFIVGK